LRMARRRFVLVEGLLLAAIVAGLTGLSGCRTAVNWHLGSFDDAHSVAVKRGRNTFVYFRSWYSVDCTQFEDQVLSNPRVLEKLDAFVCVPLEYDWDKSLAERWGLRRTPATAIVDVNRQLVAKTEGTVSVQQMLDQLALAPPASAPAATSRPARSPTKPKPSAEAEKPAAGENAPAERSEAPSAPATPAPTAPPPAPVAQPAPTASPAASGIPEMTPARP
jgi:hypothetical protein